MFSASKSSDRMSIVKLEKPETSGIIKKHYGGMRFDIMSLEEHVASHDPGFHER